MRRRAGGVIAAGLAAMWCAVLPSTEPADPVDRFHQQVLVELALAELERPVQQLMRFMPGLESPTPRPSRRVRRSRVRRKAGGYLAL